MCLEYLVRFVFRMKLRLRTLNANASMLQNKEKSMPNDYEHKGQELGAVIKK